MRRGRVLGGAGGGREPGRRRGGRGRSRRARWGRSPAGWLRRSPGRGSGGGAEGWRRRGGEGGGGAWVEAGVAGVGGGEDVSAGGERAGLVFGVRGGVEAKDAAVYITSAGCAGVGEGDVAGGSSLPGGAADLGVEQKIAAV